MQVKERFTSRTLGTVLVFGLLVGFIVGERLSPSEFGANAAPRGQRSFVSDEGLAFYPLPVAPAPARHAPERRRALRPEPPHPRR